MTLMLKRLPVSRKNEFMDAAYPQVGESIRTEKKITDEAEATLKKAIEQFKETFLASEGR